MFAFDAWWSRALASREAASETPAEAHVEARSVMLQGRYQN